MDHDPNASAGENIALFSPASDTILENATGLWLAEKTAYSYGIFDGSQVEAAGHYTQVCFWILRDVDFVCFVSWITRLSAREEKWEIGWRTRGRARRETEISEMEKIMMN